ncbi:MAG: decaprenyl-phosphate phosphoribosyltransferase [Alphaproteobacteria bacterium]|nr:decaprenyl-phosphate phosphoribosyltransferase [Alphaproteobacteria bacterium]
MTEQPKPIAALELLKLMRPRQWVKNAFVLAPLVFAREFTDPAAVANALIAFVLFCVASSAGYILNDIHDIQRDRSHPSKRHSRPLAAGTVSARPAIGLLIACYFVLIVGFFWSSATMLAILAYVVLNVVYTYVLKHQPVLDIFSIAAGFVLRVYAGALALSVSLSSWMAITTLCLALYLAAIKRRQELANNGSESREVLRMYSVELIDRYAEMSATGALIFYSLFVISANARLIWTIPLVIFGLYRYWYVIESRGGGDSPTDTVLTDLPLAVVILIWIGACMIALAP